ncbi:MAG: AAA family ATPase [Sphingomonas sp.]|uniref:KGGVGR-motif variant AAA ATPase n=1 Tax=Sphingomonas sp. TaxID=28214 RepID=UPI0025F96748|nr:AAA family ATPase [Sphingomonas sp.]MBY0284983.1 AAA family ATPase [Sphingomonas sp.]
MYVTTFYSYKGGVGRTMALANVAALLAHAGKRVLIVDFDLEAPGVPSYGPLSCARGLPGIVDYILHYLETTVSPDVANYIVKCPLDEEHAVWVMPAGDNTQASYSDRFASIDWGFLYEHQHGYDMLEDLRRQWAAHDIGFDYVLIDSRTGNTDIGGICTRQLPDAVVTMFVPTEQNIGGLAPIVGQIREETIEQDRRIELIFCPSNIPDLFDEDDILGKALKSAASRLGYGNPAELEPPVTHIHHWQNMELLEQPLIVLNRSQSKLAKEYNELKTAIIEQNPIDREGAVASLMRLPQIYEAARRATKGQAATKVIERASEIARLHEGDGEIAIMAAGVFSTAGEYEQEERSLSDVIRAGLKTERARMLRAVARINLNKKEEALQDLKAVLSSPNGTIFEFRPAAQLLRVMADDPVSDALAIFQQSETRLSSKVVLSHLIMQDRRNHDLVANAFLAASRQNEMSPELRKDVTNALMLALIGAGRFRDAIDIGNQKDDENLAEQFNFAIAEWGATDTVPTDQFVALDARLSADDDGDPNLHQCIALVRGVVGRVDEALRELTRAEERITAGGNSFSCWTFTTHRSGEEFLKDLREMRETLQNGKIPKPPFLNRRD